MNKILTIAWKELYTTFRDRNLILIMFLTPIVLSTIMGLAFGGLNGDSGSSAFSHIPIAVVNLDEGFNLADQIAADGDTGDAIPSLNDLEIEIGGETVNLGEQLQLNPDLNITDTDLSANNAAFSFGDQLASILLSENITTSDAVTDTSSADATGFNLEVLTCSLFAEEDDDESPFGFEGTLDDLLDVVVLDDVDMARAGVDSGTYVAAVIIPADYSNQLAPTFDFGDVDSADLTDPAENGIVEVYANAGQSISASIVRAVVEGIVNQFVRISVALDSVLNTSVNTLLDNLTLSNLEELDLSTFDPDLIIQGFQELDSSILEPLGCLILPEAGNVQLQRQPLDEIQTRSGFAFIMVILGSAQAIFFAMFTGIFGMNSIYEEQNDWTLQRLIASPTPRSAILAGKLLGNLVVVAAQLAILFTAFTVIASLVEGQPTLIWGSNIPALVIVILAISLFVSGLGVLVVGIAKNSEQVQFFGPMISITLGAIGGAFGFRLPPEIAGFSPLWWATEALERLSTGEIAKLGTPLLVLLGIGLFLFGVGTFFFKRRLEL